MQKLTSASRLTRPGIVCPPMPPPGSVGWVQSQEDSSAPALSTWRQTWAPFTQRALVMGKWTWRAGDEGGGVGLAAWVWPRSCHPLMSNFGWVLPLLWPLVPALALGSCLGQVSQSSLCLMHRELLRGWGVRGHHKPSMLGGRLGLWEGAMSQQPWRQQQARQAFRSAGPASLTGPTHCSYCCSESLSHRTSNSS